MLVCAYMTHMKNVQDNEDSTVLEEYHKMREYKSL